MSHEIQQEYAMRIEGNAAYRVAVWSALTREFFASPSPGATILDLGRGSGEFVNQVNAPHKYGMDLHPDSPAKLAPEVTFLDQDCSEPWALPDESLDVVFTSNFFELLPSKKSLRRTLGHVFRCLKTAGQIIGMAPNLRFLPDNCWNFWNHNLALAGKWLREGLRLTGFRIQLEIDRFLPHNISQGFTPPLLLLRTYLRSGLLWRLLGKQFLVIAQKPGGFATGAD